MDRFVRWLSIISQAEHLRLGTRNCAYGERVWLSVCTLGERGARVLVFEVKPVVAVLQAENMKFIVGVDVTTEAKVDA